MQTSLFSCVLPPPISSSVQDPCSQNYTNLSGPKVARPLSTAEMHGKDPSLPLPNMVPVVQVALHGSWDESFQRYMSAGLTPGRRPMGLGLQQMEQRHLT